jgi:hypothetical protein
MPSILGLSLTPRSERSGRRPVPLDLLFAAAGNMEELTGAVFKDTQPRRRGLRISMATLVRESGGMRL